jgi:hypothetical protein
VNVDLKIAAVYDKLEQKINAVTKAAGPKGDKGDQGPQGDSGTQGPKGPKGDKGDKGLDGKTGKDGQDGKDGVGIESVEEAIDGNIVFNLSDGSQYDIDVTGLMQEATQNIVSSNTVRLHDKTWIDYVNGYTTTPTLLQTIADGDVYEYTYTNTTLYRLVPTGSAIDSFYRTFSGGVLSGLVVEKTIIV